MALGMLDDEPLAVRLVRRIGDAMRELRRDPVGFARALVAPEALDRQSRRLLWAMRLGVPAASVGGFSLGVLLYLLFIGPPTASAARPDAEPPLHVTAWAGARQHRVATTHRAAVAAAGTTT